MAVFADSGTLAENPVPLYRGTTPRGRGLVEYAVEPKLLNRLAASLETKLVHDMAFAVRGWEKLPPMIPAPAPCTDHLKIVEARADGAVAAAMMRRPCRECRQGCSVATDLAAQADVKTDARDQARFFVGGLEPDGGHRPRHARRLPSTPRCNRGAAVTAYRRTG